MILAISHSGETEELLRLLETIKRLRAPDHDHRSGVDALQGGRRRPRLPGVRGSLPAQSVPTASTTAALALGDALAMTLLVAKGFRQEDFANLHPGGKLGSA